MWISVPNKFCHCAPELADSTLALEWRSQLLEQFAMSRSKPLRANSWQRAWKTKPWTRRLFGRIYEPSTANHGVEKWIASLPDIPASPLALQENSKQKTLRRLARRTCARARRAGTARQQKTPATSGQKSTELCKKSSQAPASLKMSADIYDWGLSKSTMTFADWVTALRQAYFPAIV